MVVIMWLLARGSLLLMRQILAKGSLIPKKQLLTKGFISLNTSLWSTNCCHNVSTMIKLVQAFSFQSTHMARATAKTESSTKQTLHFPFLSSCWFASARAKCLEGDKRFGSIALNSPGTAHIVLSSILWMLYVREMCLDPAITSDPINLATSGCTATVWCRLSSFQHLASPAGPHQALCFLLRMPSKV